LTIATNIRVQESLKSKNLSSDTFIEQHICLARLLSAQISDLIVKGVLTTISFSWALLILLSSANFQPFASFTKAVSGISAVLSSSNHSKRERETEGKEGKERKEGKRQRGKKRRKKEEGRRKKDENSQCPELNVPI
jgi:hypothetical protein